MERRKYRKLFILVCSDRDHAQRKKLVIRISSHEILAHRHKKYIELADGKLKYFHWIWKLTTEDITGDEMTVVLPSS